MRRASSLLAAALALSVASACASAPVVVPIGNAYPDVPQLVIPTTLAVSTDVRTRHDLGWRQLQAGDLGLAGRAFGEALALDGEFFPAATGLGYVAVLERRYEEAAEQFDVAIALNPEYLPALTGRLDVALLAQDETAALTASELILAVDPTREDVRAQQDVLRLQVIQARLAFAASSRARGDLDEAQEALDQALTMVPDSAVVLREVALVEIARGAFDEAESHARRSLELDRGDAETYAVLATVLEAHGRLRDAAAALNDAGAIDPRGEWRDRADALTARAEFAALPAEFQAIPSASSVTRGQLAALLGLRLESALAQAPRRVTVVLTDVQAHWAASWILPVARAGWMETFANHTFQPTATLRRVDLATAVWRVVQDLSANRPQDVARWRSSRPTLSDVPSTHLAYDAIAGALASGAIGLGDGERFLPGGLVTGPDVTAAMARLEQLVSVDGGLR